MVFVFAESTPAKKVEAPKAVKKQEQSQPEKVAAPTREPVASRFANIKIDAADLMKVKRVPSRTNVAVPVPKKEADHAHIRGSEPPEPSRPKVRHTVA